MELTPPPSDSFEDTLNALFYESTEPLFEEQAEESREVPVQDSLLKDRVDTLEYRLGRSLLCLNQCQKELSDLRKQCRALSQQQSRCQDRQDRQSKVTRYLLYTAAGLFLTGLAIWLAPYGWQLLGILSTPLDTEPARGAGTLVMATVLWLAAKLALVLIRALISPRRKESARNAVSDR